MLSPRLQFIYDQLLPEQDVWDLCCDHGYLGIVALKSKRFRNIHFVDQAQHLVLALQAKWGHEAAAYFYPHSAQTILTAMNGNIVIAGVGASKIIEILAGLSQQQDFRSCRLILVPHKDEEQLESMLEPYLIKFRLDQRLSVQEGPRVRRVFVLNSRDDFGVA